MKNNCEKCENCLYIGEGDFICDRYNPPVIIKDNWNPTDYYCNCKACKEFRYE